MRFRLISQHYIDDRLLPADTIVGDGKDAVAYSGPPSMMMEPLDKEAEEAIKKYNIDKKKRPEAMTPPTQLGAGKVPLYKGPAETTIQPQKNQGPTLQPGPTGQVPLQEIARQDQQKAAAPKPEPKKE